MKSYLNNVIYGLHFSYVCIIYFILIKKFVDYNKCNIYVTKNYSFSRYGKGKIASQLAEIRILYCGAVTLSLSEDLGF